MPKQILQPKSLPVPKPAYSPGIKKGNLVFTAGMIPQDAQGDLVGEGDIAAQTRQCLMNLEAVLAEGGAALDDVVKCSIFLSDIGNAKAMNEVYKEFFPRDKPGRTTVQAALARPQMLVEIEAIAVLDD